MSAEDSKLVVQRFWEEVFNEGILEVANEILASDWCLRQSKWTGGDLDLAGLQDMLGKFRERYPDLHTQSVESAVVEGGGVLTRFTVTGTHHGTGNQVVVEGMSISLFFGDRIKESWVNWDAFGLIVQEDPSDRWPLCWWCK